MPEPQWLTSEESRAWEALLWMTRAVDLALDRQLQRDSRIPHAAYGILVALSRREGQAMRMGVLAEALGWSQSRLSHAVARMETAGWIRRIPCPADKRSYLAQLTEAGRQKLAEAAPGHVAAVRHLVIDALTPEQLGALTEIGDAVVHRAADMLGEAAPFKHILDQRGGDG